jgi:hypothetical protein
MGVGVVSKEVKRWGPETEYSPPARLKNAGVVPPIPSLPPWRTKGKVYL